MQTGARNSSFTRLRKGAATTICAMLVSGASLAQGQPAATAPTPPNRAAPAQPKQRQLAPTPEQEKPTPPRRPASPQQPAGAPVRAPAAAPKAPPPAALAPVPPHTSAPVDTSQPPPSLPRAPREKMRACAEEWDKMKRESNSGLPMWRDFATDCLTR